MKWFLIQLIHFYRITLGPFLGGRCRFVPTCSQYAIDAIQRHGPCRGSWRAFRRVCRCHPLGKGGYDPA
jgi:putative membrane protein insertion efficiency factor